MENMPSSRLTLFLLIMTVIFLGPFGYQEWGAKYKYAWHPPKVTVSPDHPQIATGQPDSQEPPVHIWVAENQKPWMQIIISLALMSTALIVILNTRYGPKDKHWAYGILGTLIGFWLRS